ncbi:ribosomal-processing cysteine protease Prp [Acidaminobacter sp. JC074]|uniref:ribosomal-processing cysteine protease Prp n=1 Tax=Acidaminobacter sp. JC074 TaxID=2530199 RepID=UPI001F0FE76C|nr:ribosomal-processing cysteine protease Prp [Acidaminobacter sp. JC074]MCH4886664.1 ribosomal-processing cysteine protease Prp [Acidaminobacter sp. JC074]
MTEVTVLIKDSIVSIEADGHAGFADHGEDIVCAAISVLMQTAVNSLEKVAGIPENRIILEMDEDGYMYLEKPAKLDEAMDVKAEIVLQTVLTGLEGIAEAYPQYIKLYKREVQTYND